MPRLTPGAFPFFGRLFRTEEGGSPGELDLTGPVQVVVDGSRAAQRGIDAYGSVAVSTVGAATARDSVQMRTLLRTMSPALDPDAHDVWLMGTSFVYSDPYTVAVLGTIGSNAPPALQSVNRAFPRQFWSAALGVELIATEGLVAANAIGTQTPQKPILIRPDNDEAGIYVVASTPGAATALRWMFHLVITPRGGTPPGAA